MGHTSNVAGVAKQGGKRGTDLSVKGFKRMFRTTPNMIVILVVAGLSWSLVPVTGGLSGVVALPLTLMAIGKLEEVGITG